MDYVNLGATGLRVSRIALGCMSFGIAKAGWGLDEEQSRSIVRKAIELGVNFFDTANMYGSGESEIVTGRALKDFAQREDVVIATKVYFPMREGPNGRGLSRKAIFHEVDSSLKRLGTDYIDLYQIHRWDPHTPIEETLQALDDLVRAGKVLYLGASSMFAWQFATALHLSSSRGWSRFVSMQNHYNLLHREEEREMIPLCAARGIAVIPWSPLARGRLARSPDQWRSTARSTSDQTAPSLYDRTEEADREIAGRVAEIARRRGATSAGVALSWLLSKPGVTAPILGATGIEQLAVIPEALDLELDRQENDYLEENYIPHGVVGYS